ncbi:Uncharacterised protein [Bordetella trematum]|uniref:Uncharacterized protein n=2 Tax=Bordetella trematum TaxID=123899 RepID=A0A157SJL5_9BORD|nr:hypothetical protein [Bordetella trematum]NNH20603.1 hypothetical protein [Bordetella trematum]SAI20855.1 Uncharacterised protein [Bordetella trematum]SAI70649.1 Uncharacterised protein [Bordetella trematum]SUV98690.1 Uncharacterised protein [Bordetella trematum]
MDMTNKKATVAELYRYHTANLRALKAAKGQIAPLAKAAISTNRTAELTSLLKLYAFLIGAWAEVRLQKVLHEPSAFSAIERASVSNERTQLDQWKRLAEVAFRKHYHIEPATPVRTFPFTARSRFEAILKLFDNELSVVITVRNKLAHGQWAYALNGANDAVEQGIMKELRRENFLSLQFKDALISCIADIANILVVSQQTFERDFDRLFAKLEQLQANLENRQYAKYEAMLIARHQRAKQARSGGG